MSPVIPTSPASSETRPTRESTGPSGGLHPLQGKAVEFVRSNLQERPLVTLGVAAAVGLLIGRLVKR
ncbi:glycine zipper domain-containing protein [Botrimarina mediterranea]|uniref:glycine zipper domain-containing protein n=1 Tax=Botrimarina mediterranea TaxID=2528022 RepID=UPI0036F4A3DA